MQLRPFFRKQGTSCCKGCHGLFDDILITGETDEEHWRNVGVVLQRLQNNVIRIRKEKCSFM